MLVPSRGNDFELGVRLFYVDCFIVVFLTTISPRIMEVEHYPK